MKSILNAVDRFCYRHPRFGIPNLMIIIAIGNAAVYFLRLMDTTGLLYGFLAFSPAAVLHGQIWRIVTFLFVPSYGSLIGTAISVYLYYFIGSTLENLWGKGKFTIYYFSGVLLTVVYALAVYLVSGRQIFLTSQYMNLSMFFSFAVLFPDTRLLVFFFIPVKITILALIDALFFLYSVIVTPFPDNMVPVVAVVNFLIFCASGFVDEYIRSSGSRARQRKKRSEFRGKIRQIQYEDKRRPYNRRCEVCGKTDADYPQLEFRYCSRCAGYHCFCMEHINNHIHFTE